MSVVGPWDHVLLWVPRLPPVSTLLQGPAAVGPGGADLATVGRTLVDWVGLFAFGLAGALKGSDADLDLFGVVVLGFLTAFGGGAVRDTLVGRTPVTFLRTPDVVVALAGVVVAVALFRGRQHLTRTPLFRTADALGLAAFAASGAAIGWEAGVSPFGVVVLATLTGVGGGSIGDLLLTRVPVVLREEFYATPAAVGGATYWLVRATVAGPPVPALVAVLVVLALRLVAVRREWQLPTL